MASPTFLTSAAFPERGLRLREDSLDATFDRIAPVHARGTSPVASFGGTLLPAGWCRLATGLRGTRLYRVSLPGQAAIYWEAAMKLGGKLLHRRFAGELHARAWLSATTEPRETGIPFDLEEIHGPIRTAGIKGGSRVPF
jgi:hypothetical protein